MNSRLHTNRDKRHACPFLLPVLRFLADAATPAALDVGAHFRKGQEVLAAAAILDAPGGEAIALAGVEVLDDRMGEILSVPWQWAAV